MAGGVNFGSLDDLSNIHFGDLMQGAAEAAPVVDGKPRMILLTDIEEDPDQPRKEFDETSLKEMADSITATGVKQPVSVRPHPDKPGCWILNFGARRYRGSIKAGKEAIPAFIDERCDNFDQVIENEQREGLSPVEMALFIEKKEAEGFKKGEIARRIGKQASYISKVAALVDMPQSVRAVYDSRRCRDIESLYQLTKAYDDFSSAIDEFCANSESLTQAGVRAFLEAQRKAKAAPPAGVATKPVEQFQLPQPGLSAGFSNTPSETAGAGKGEGGSAGDGVQEQAGKPAAVKTDEDTGGKSEVIEATATPAGARPPVDPEKVRKPIVMIQHDERPGRLLIDRRCAVGLAWIKYDDDGHEIEVDIFAVQLQGIIEGA